MICTVNGTFTRAERSIFAISSSRMGENILRNFTAGCPRAPCSPRWARFVLVAELRLIRRLVTSVFADHAVLASSFSNSDAKSSVAFFRASCPLAPVSKHWAWVRNTANSFVKWLDAVACYICRLLAKSNSRSFSIHSARDRAIGPHLPFGNTRAGQMRTRPILVDQTRTLGINSQSSMIADPLSSFYSVSARSGTRAPFCPHELV